MLQPYKLVMYRQILTFTESTGNIAQCSATPANAPAVHDTRRGVDGGRLSYSSITVVIFDHNVNQFSCHNIFPPLLGRSLRTFVSL